MSEQYEAKAGEGVLAVAGSLTLTAGGGVLQLYGGTREHVGSVTVSAPRPSLTGGGRTSVTSSVINLPSHKEELVGRPAAEKLAVELDMPIVCVAGIHVDGATAEELHTLAKNAEDAVELLLDALAAAQLPERNDHTFE